MNSAKITTLLIASLMCCTLSAQTIRRDYQKHILTGILIGGATTGVLQHYRVKNAWIYGAASGVVIGAIKEVIFDKAMKLGNADYKDFLCTSAGSISASYVIKFSIKNK